jgi:hypothetical protein
VSQTICFYGPDGAPFGEATLDDAGEVHYSDDSVRILMESSVIVKGVAWAWARFSSWGASTGPFSRLVTDDETVEPATHNSTVYQSENMIKDDTEAPGPV